MSDVDPVEGPLEGDAMRLLKLEPRGGDVFRNRFSEMEHNDHLFGGQVLAQSLAAAMATVADQPAHSLHAYFLRAGSARGRVDFAVERVRDGRHFSVRRVVATQAGRALFHMECSFHFAESGVGHDEPPPDVPAPETLHDATMLDMIEGRIDRRLSLVLRRQRLVDMRFVDPEQLFRPAMRARQRFWIRVPSAAASEDVHVHQALLAYLSDWWLSMTALVAHSAEEATPELSVNSLDHAIWFHAPPRADEWLLCDCDSPWAGGGRGLSRALFYDRVGRLIASVAQEALFRRK